jgi:large subunit ribosomal protein L10e
MRKAFGKPIGLAARVDIGSVVLELSLKAENMEKGKEAMKAAATKLPMKTRVEVVKLEKPLTAPVQG